MTRADLLDKVTVVLAEILDDDEVVLTEATTAEDVDGWDSISHVKLIIALEAELGIRFEAKEISDMEDVGALLDLIEQHSEHRT